MKSGSKARVRVFRELFGIEFSIFAKHLIIWNFMLLERQGKAVFLCVKKYAVFRGCSTRAEFWWCVPPFLGLYLLTYWVLPANMSDFEFAQPYTFPLILSVILIVPAVSLMVRRCHDAGKSGWWILCPLYNIIIFLSPSVVVPESNKKGTCVMVSDENPVIGDENDEYLQHGPTCAVKAQQIILNEFGIDVSEKECVELARRKGWFAPPGYEGTPREFVGKLLGYYGVPYHTYEHATLNDLMRELSEGHKVITFVDAFELYSPEFMRDEYDYIEGFTPNHSIIVSGIDAADAFNKKVYITDSRHGVCNYACPMDNFLDAWQDSLGEMCATDNPVPGWNPDKRVEPYEFDLSEYPSNTPKGEEKKI